MKLIRIMLAVGALALVAVSSPSGTAGLLDDWGIAGDVYTAGGSVGDWTNTTPRTETGKTGDIYWAEGNNTVPENTVYGPGPSGGEAYDIEFLSWRRVNGQVQVLGISSIDPNDYVNDFHLGDIFIDVDGVDPGSDDGFNGYEYALSLGQYNTKRGFDHLHPGDGFYTHSADVGLYAINGVDDVHGISTNQGYGYTDQVYNLSDPLSIRGDGNEVLGAGVTRTVELLGDDNGKPNWAIQFTIDQTVFESLLPTLNGFPDYSNLVLHWTLECGNDWIDTEAPGDREPVVPEPATLTLFGLGLATMGMMRRRRQS
jgi:hypothetical protein